MGARVARSTETRVTEHDGAGIDAVVRRAQQGDVAAFETIYRTHSPAVYALCRRMAGDEREARDLVQDVFVRAWEKLTLFRGQSALGTWLHRLAANVVLEHFRSTRRDALRFIDVDDAALNTKSPAQDAQLDLTAALATLPAGARAVFVLSLEGYSHDEIAQMTGTAPGTTRAQLWRARRALARLLDP
jgi:RNA polymerase sigma-70 factor (ECF subfamily)